ncbi:MAG: hypothetical protein HZB26_02320 [Candidatus Hydrogenedentes bacterium]|nr:hypothetical protein [Candidatus Hydrogenedentota bacterium]
MVFVKTFKGYEDKVAQIDQATNDWIKANNVDVVGVKIALAHNQSQGMTGGDLIYTVLYRAEAPIR